jgi:predicted metal-dependent hydrolase
VELKQNSLLLRIRSGSSEEKKQATLDQWYRAQLKEAVPPVIAKWERLMGVKVNAFFVRRMKTKWGSCNSDRSTIRLNSELAKKPHECLEYIVVHEMAHLLEPTHNHRFVALMDKFMPKWQFHRDNLNRLPVRHESWGY